MTREEAEDRLVDYILDWLKESGIISYLPAVSKNDVLASFADDWKQRGIDMILAAEEPNKLREAVREEGREIEALKKQLADLQRKVQHYLQTHSDVDKPKDVVAVFNFLRELEGDLT